MDYHSLADFRAPDLITLDGLWAIPQPDGFLELAIHLDLYLTEVHALEVRAGTLTFDSQYPVQALHVSRWILVQGQPVEHHGGRKGFHPRSLQNSDRVAGSRLDVKREPRCSTSRSIVG